MDYSLFIQLGLGGGILYVLYDNLKRGDKREREFNARLDDRDKAFVQFVNEHNDKMVKLVVESTSAIQESTKAIKASTGAIEQATKLLCDVSKKINGDS